MIEQLEDRRLLALDSGATLRRPAAASAPTAVPVTPATVVAAPIATASTNATAIVATPPSDTRFKLSAIESRGQSVPVIAGEWVVKLDPLAHDTSLAADLAAARDVISSRVKGFESITPLASDDTFLIRTSVPYGLTDLSAALAPIAGFELVEPNFLAHKDDTLPNDPSFPNQWALHNTGQSGGKVDADIDAPAAWDVNTGSGKTVVAVVDSGVDYNHPDLNDNMWRNPGEIAGDGVDNDGNGFVDDVYGYDFLNGDSDPLDDEGHGTSVAGIIAAEGNNNLGVTGVNWDAQVMALKIFDPAGFAGTAQIIAAINYATMMKHSFGIDVIATNHSWGTVGYSTLLRDAIAASGAEDILFVASAGNQQHDNDIAPQYPASYDLDNIISVAATDRLDNRASFTSYGATSVDLGAPGVSTQTTAMGGGYRNFSGTSASAPYVTGVAALVHDTYPKASALAVKQAILDGVDPVASMAGITLTGGRLNLFGALKAMPAQVTAATPDDGDNVSVAPLDFAIETALAINPATVGAGDLTVNGLPANSVTINTPTKLTFHFNSSPVTAQGAQQIHIAAGAFARQFDGDGVEEFTATFHYDALSLMVTGSTPAAGGLVPLPLTAVRLDFNEAINPLSVDVADLHLSRGTVAGVTVVDNNTVEFQLAGITDDRHLTVTLGAGAITDGFGNPNQVFSEVLELDGASIAAAPFERLDPLGGLVFASHIDGRLSAAADVDQLTFFLEAGQTVAVRVTPLDPAASVSAELLGIAPLAVSPSPGQAALIPAVLANADGTLTLRVSGDRATDYRVEILRNADLENPALATPQSIDGSAIEIGSRRLAVVGAVDTPGDVDRFTLDLSASLGHRIDIVLGGQHGVDQSDATLELIAPGGAVVVATADPLANGATNYDLAILGFVPTQVGTYELRFTSNTLGQYGIVVTDELLFESEVNDGPLAVLRSLDGVDGVAGFVDRTGQLGAFQFTVDTSRSAIAISGGVGTPEDGIVAPFLPQAPGGMASNLQGTVSAVVSEHSIHLGAETNVFPFVKPGPFQPGNAPADFAASLNVPPFIVGGTLAMRNTEFGMFVDQAALDPSGNFAANQLSLALRETLAANIPGVFNDSVQVDDTFVDNQAVAPASLKLVGGRLELTLPIQVRIIFPVPQLPVAGIFDLVGQIVATAVVAGTEDLYTVSLAPGETLALETRTPFDDPSGTPGNPLDPALELRNGSGAVVAADDNSASDGRNARVVFTAPAGGTFTVHVLSPAGQGEYVLAVDKSLPPVLDPIGNHSLAEGSTLSFTAHATDPDGDAATYSLGLGAPAGATIDPVTGQFSWKPGDNTGSPFPITVIATDSSGAHLVDSETILVTVSNVAPVIQSVSTVPALAKEGEVVKLTVTFTDVGTLDTHTALVNWGDGSTAGATVVEAGGSGSFVATHVYAAGGSYTIKFTLTDDDGGPATGERSLLVTGIGVHEVGGVTTLQVIGSGGPDTITITPARNNRLNVFASFLSGLNRTVPAAGLDLIEVRGLGGSDFISIGSILGSVNLPALVDGGDGNDTIMGGSGGNVLLGGRGNDLLFAGAARDLLIGGEGADYLFGNGGDDLLIAGYTSYDGGGGASNASNDAALLALLREWQSTRSYSARTANIVAGSGPALGSTSFSLKKGTTVFDDSQTDVLYGGTGLDWYFYNSRDTALGKTAAEKANS